MSHIIPNSTTAPNPNLPTYEEMEAAAALVECCKTLKEWRGKAQAKGGPLEGKAIPIKIERIVIEEIFAITKDVYQKTTDTFNVNQRMN